VQAPGIDWSNLKRAVSYTEYDSLAVLRDLDYNAIEWAPVFLNEATGEPYISRDGRWWRVQDVPGFERYEKARFKRLFDTATGQLV
jgi:hypothetical protein